MAIERNAMARSLNQLYNAIHHLQTTPVNPLMSHLPTTLSISVADIPVSIVVSPKATETDESWAQWGEMDDMSSSESEDSDSSDRVFTKARSDVIRVEPWQTLLMLDDWVAGKVSAEVLGQGVAEDPDDDEEGMLKSLIDEITVTKP